MIKLSEVVRTVIDLASVVKREVEEREWQHPLGRMYDPMRKRREPTDAEGRLRDYIHGLPVAVVYTLTLAGTCSVVGQASSASRLAVSASLCSMPINSPCPSAKGFPHGRGDGTFS
jgi:hypothetical protein